MLLWRVLVSGLLKTGLLVAALLWRVLEPGLLLSAVYSGVLRGMLVPALLPVLLLLMLLMLLCWLLLPDGLRLIRLVVQHRRHIGVIVIVIGVPPGGRDVRVLICVIRTHFHSSAAI